MQVLPEIPRSLIRTVTPMIFGFLIEHFTGLADFVNLDDFQGAVTVGVGVLFYIFPRLAEVNLNENFGWLLGAKGAPSYEPSQATYAGVEEFISVNSVSDADEDKIPSVPFD